MSRSRCLCLGAIVFISALVISGLPYRSEDEIVVRTRKVLDTVETIYRLARAESRSPTTYEEVTKQVKIILKPISGDIEALRLVAYVCRDLSANFAEDRGFGEPFETGLWEACELIALRGTDESVELLVKMQEYFHFDAGNSIIIKTLVERAEATRDEKNSLGKK